MFILSDLHAVPNSNGVVHPTTYCTLMSVIIKNVLYDNLCKVMRLDVFFLRALMT